MYEVIPSMDCDYRWLIELDYNCTYSKKLCSGVRRHNKRNYYLSTYLLQSIAKAYSELSAIYRSTLDPQSYYHTQSL